MIITLCLSWLGHVLEFVSYLTHFYYTLHFPYSILVSTLYSSRGLLLCFPHCFPQECFSLSAWSLGI